MIFYGYEVWIVSMWLYVCVVIYVICACVLCDKSSIQRVLVLCLCVCLVWGRIQVGYLTLTLWAGVTYRLTVFIACFCVSCLWTVPSSVCFSVCVVLSQWSCVYCDVLCVSWLLNCDCSYCGLLLKESEYFWIAIPNQVSIPYHTNTQISQYITTSKQIV